MSSLVIGLIVTGLLLWALQGFAKPDQRLLARILKPLGGVAALGIAISVGARGHYEVAIPLGLAALGLLGWMPFDLRTLPWLRGCEPKLEQESRPEPNVGRMSVTEAYEVLGLPAGASEADISSAHRSLMKRLHPDQGGSTYLAARVNQAKDVLLRGR